MVNLIEDRDWFNIPANLNYDLSTTTVVRAPKGVVPTQDDGEWTLSFSDENFKCGRIPESDALTFHLDSPDAVTPEYWVRALLIMFTYVRWTVIIGRGVMLAARPTYRQTRSQVCTFIFVYASICVLTLALLGLELTDCIEWTAFVHEPFRLFSLQPIFWVLNIVTFAVGLTLYFVIYHYACTVRSGFSWQDIFKIFLFLTFLGTALLPSVTVLALGFNKLWNALIILGAVLFLADYVLRRKPAESPRAQPSDPHRSRNILPTTEDGRPTDQIVLLKELQRSLEQHRDERGDVTETRCFKRTPDSLVCVVTDQSGRLVTPEPMWAPSRKAALTNPPDEGIFDMKGRDDELCCSICLEREMEVIFEPCLHGNTCYDCLTQITVSAIRRQQELIRRQQLRRNILPRPGRGGNAPEASAAPNTEMAASQPETDGSRPEAATSADPLVAEPVGRREDVTPTSPSTAGPQPQLATATTTENQRAAAEGLLCPYCRTPVIAVHKITAHIPFETPGPKDKEVEVHRTPLIFEAVCVWQRSSEPSPAGQ